MNNHIKPKLKETIPYFLLDQEVQIGEEVGVAGFIDDPTGCVAKLVSLLDGNHSLQEIVTRVQADFAEISEEEIRGAIQAMDQEGYLEDASLVPRQMDSYLTHRYKANLNYLSLFTDIYMSKYELQEKINNAKISLLGVGGLGSQILYHLAALGFHQIKILDFDTLDLSNFNRQLLYSEEDLGRLKVDMAKKRIAQFNPNVNLETTNRKIESARDVYEHVHGADYVISVADRPTLDIQDWVNEGVVAAGLPMVSGGVLNTRGRFFTMIPGQTGCVQCHVQQVMTEDEKQKALERHMRSVDFQRNNAAISPNVAILAGILVNELLKVVTGTEEPLSLARVMEFNFLDFTTSEVSAWTKQETCPICGKQERALI
ncbi:MAG TPA: ThiF family adenylyltransferase [Bacilli bacterium]|nr:ThiF family adenylyltransferase [Bacilli bacterium]